MMFTPVSVSSCPNTNRDTSLFFSNFLHILSEHGVGNSMPSQLCSQVCFLSSGDMRSGRSSGGLGWRALVAAYMKHLSSSLFMLISAFFRLNTTGTRIFDESLRDLFMPTLMSNLTILLSVQPLPFFKNSEKDSKIFAVILS